MTDYVIIDGASRQVLADTRRLPPAELAELADHSQEGSRHLFGPLVVRNLLDHIAALDEQLEATSAALGQALAAYREAVREQQTQLRDAGAGVPS